jgi:hypothetical protein
MRGFFIGTKYSVLSTAIIEKARLTGLSLFISMKLFLLYLFRCTLYAVHCTFYLAFPKTIR